MNEPREVNDLHVQQRKAALKGAIILGLVAVGIYVWALISQL